jgi:predicted DNA-binding transcriptional regulator YafY
VRASRLVTILLLLQARGRQTAAELAGELETSVRTIQRDIEALSAAGVPVYSERGRAGGYCLVGGYRSRLTGLGRDEAQALLSIGAAGPAHELGLGQALMSARLKLAAALPTALRQQVSATAGRFHLDAPGWFTTQPPTPHLEALAAGVFGDLAVEARYRGRKGAHDCRLEPLGLVLKAGKWYVIASESGVARGYRADRFERAAVTDQPFSRPSGFDLSTFWAAWREEFERGLPVVTVTVRARASCARSLRRVIEPAHAREVDWDAPPDAAGWARLQLPFEKLEYARAALLGFGADVEVLSPQELRSQMIATAAALGALYTERQPARRRRQSLPAPGPGHTTGALVQAGQPRNRMLQRGRPHMPRASPPFCSPTCACRGSS